MAYSATVTVTQSRDSSGRRNWLVTVVETGTAVTDEYTVTLSGLPTIVSLLSCQVTRVSGSATTIQPRISATAADPDDTGVGYQTTYRVATYRVYEKQPLLLFPDAAGKLYFRSQPDGGAADNAITTTLLFVEGAVDAAVPGGWSGSTFYDRLLAKQNLDGTNFGASVTIPAGAVGAWVTTDTNTAALTIRHDGDTAALDQEPVGASWTWMPTGSDAETPYRAKTAAGTKAIEVKASVSCKASIWAKVRVG